MRAIRVIFFLCITIQSYSQCLEESDVLFPEKTITKKNFYGGEMAGYKDYLLVSATHNDSLEFNGGLVYLYKLISNKWEKVAELSSSEYVFQMYLGRKIAIDENIIVVAGNTYSSEGFHFDELLIYTKQEQDEWTDSTESYRLILRNDLKNSGLVVRQIVINNKILGVSYYTSDEDIVVFYEINPDQTLSYINTVVGPKDKLDNNGEFGIDFDFSTNIIAIGASSFRGEETNRTGRLFVYNWNDVKNIENPSPVAILMPENSNQQDFSIQVEVDGDVIYACNGFSFINQTSYYDYSTEVYVFNKPISGWQDNYESATLTTGVKETAGFRHLLKVVDNYAFLSRSYNENIIYGFKRETTWKNATPTFMIKKEKEFDDDNRKLAVGLAIFETKLVASYTGGYSTKNPNNLDKLISYNVSSGKYENIVDEDQEITESVYSAAESNFGQSMSYSKNRLAVGAPGDKEDGTYVGAVYIYDRDAISEKYTRSAIIRPPDGNPYDNFGFAVELDDSLLFVSSIFYDSLNADGSYFNGSIGKVYHYKLENDSWQLKSTFYSPGDLSKKSIKHFGKSLSYSDNYLAISQYYSGSSESNGKVHLFKRNASNDWEHKATMTTSEQQGGDFFGRTLILRDSLLVVGTGNPEYGYKDEMRVYLFKKKGEEWISGTEDAYLLPSDKQRFDRFGFSIDVHRDLVVVGSPGYNYNKSKPFAGKAYVFKKPIDGWQGVIQENVILEPKEALEEDFFGYDVFIDDNQILVGAASSINNPSSIWFTADVADLQPGKLYFFDPYSEIDKNRGVKNERYIQLSPNNRYLDGFGYSLEKSYDRVFVSAIFDNNESGFRAGGVYELKFATYIYSVEEPVCSESDAFQIESNVLGGIWTGEGIVDGSEGWFDPSLIEKDGWTSVTYTAGDCAMTSSIFVGSVPKLLSRSDVEIKKCVDGKAELFVTYSSITRASTQWSFRKSLSDIYQYLESNTDTLNAENDGYYRVEIDNGFCRALVIEFEVVNENIDVGLNYENFVELCSYSNETLLLVSTSNVSNVIWYFRELNGNSFSEIESSDKITPRNSGYYFATYNTELCSYSSDTVEVDYNHVDIQIEKIELLCTTDDYQLKVSPIGGVWFGNGISNEGIIDASELGSGVFNAEYKLDSGGCQFISSTDFEILLLPQPEIATINNEVCPNQPVELFISNNYNNAFVMWYSSNKENVISNGDFYVTDVPGDYYAKYNLRGCQSAFGSFTLEAMQDSLFVPNVITLNNDGFNDDFRFYVKGAKTLSLTIINRWGDTVYYDDDEKLIWYPESDASGVYYWQINYLTCDSQPKSIKGWVQILSN